VADPGNNLQIQGIICKSREQSANPGNNQQIQGTICRSRELGSEGGSGIRVMWMGPRSKGIRRLVVPFF
jgi:hypothetical protein